MGRSSSTVKNAIGTILDGLIASFCRIVVLLMRFTLPIINTEGAKDVSNLMTDDGLAAVTNQFQEGTTLDDVVFQCVDKLFVCLNTIDISDLGASANKDNSSSGTIIDGWDIRVDNVTSNILLTGKYIKSWISRFIDLLSNVPAGRRAYCVVC
jgi:hypothetical protein